MSKLKNHPALMRRLELALVNLCLIEFLIHVENEKLSSKKGKSLMSHTKANLQWCSTVQMSFRTKFFCETYYCMAMWGAGFCLLKRWRYGVLRVVVGCAWDKRGELL